jgi:hypothetical protein
VRRVVLAAVFFGWLYGAPFLLIVGLSRRASTPYVPTPAEATAFGATTDTFLTAALALNVLPVLGMLLAGLSRDRYWVLHFTGALVGVAAICLTMVIAARAAATAPLIGDVPAHQEPAPHVTQCLPRSGGTGCPGG